MIYQTYAPRHPALRPFVKTLWYIEQEEQEAAGVEPRMIPDGFYHMVFNLGAPHEYTDKNGIRYRPQQSHMNAKQTDFVKVVRSGKVEIMGAVFQPYGLHAFLQIPVNEVSGLVWNLEDVLGHAVREIEERLKAADAVMGKFAVLEACLAAMMKPDIRLNGAVVIAARHMIERNGMVAIADLVEEVQLSERSLERHFKTHIGVTPKQFADIRRMQYVLTMLRTSPERLVQVAVEGDYYDQSHFNHTFKKILGTTPREYIHQRDLLSDLYNTEGGGSGIMTDEYVKGVDKG